MKQSNLLIFAALIACLCVFFVPAEPAHATTYIPATDFTLTTYGRFITSRFAYYGSNPCGSDVVRITTLPTGGGSCGYTKNAEMLNVDSGDPLGVLCTCTSGCDLQAYCTSDSGNVYTYGNITEISTYDWEITPPAVPTLTITAPTNASTITASTTNLTGTYTSFYQDDFGSWRPINIWFTNPYNNLHSKTYTFTTSSASGSFSTPLSTFGITENGEWDLQSNQETFIMGSNLVLDLTPSPKYDLTFSVSGNSSPYMFADWATWYTANAAGGYSTPSDFGNAIAGFFTPIFTNVYEFSNNTLAFFNAATAYENGLKIGSVIPTAQAYLDNIDLFFGGFPLIPFFEFMIVIMLGVFIIRTIFKFIPFFG